MDSTSSLSGPALTPGSRVDSPVPGIRQVLVSRLVGRSQPVRCLRRQIEGMASLWIPVLLRGGPGTGRSTVAELLHAFGPTAKGELVAIEGSAFVPETRLPRVGTVHLELVEKLPGRTQGWWLERLRVPAAPGSGVRWIASTGDLGSIRDAAPDFEPELERILARFAIRVPALRERAADLP